MTLKTQILARPLALAIGSALAFGGLAATADAAPRSASAKRPTAARAAPPAGVQRPAADVYLAQGRGQLITLPVPITDVFIANDAIADVKIQSPTQLYLFGKGFGESSFYATDARGRVVYSANVFVSQNLNSADDLLKTAFPDSDVKVILAGQTAVLTGTVNSPEDAAQATVLVKSLLNPGVNISDPNALLKVMVIDRLGVATPMQVALQVRIAEVSRTVGKQIASNLRLSETASNGGFFDFSQGGSPTTTPSQGGINFGTPNFLGATLLGSLDLAESQGLATTLASPTLTARSGEEAEFVAGGEVPILVDNVTVGGGRTQSTVFKTYGIKVNFLPTVRSDGRIQMKVQPEVSQIDRSVTTQGIPGFLTRRVTTSVELGSGQSFMIGGLLRADGSNNVNKFPGLGSIPILGSLFRSTNFTRGETELMIVVTPYLIRPVSANRVMLPTDGYQIPNDAERVFLNRDYRSGTSRRPMPSVAPPRTTSQPPVAIESTATPPAPGFSN